MYSAVPPLSYFFLIGWVGGGSGQNMKRNCDSAELMTTSHCKVLIYNLFTILLCLFPGLGQGGVCVLQGEGA